MIGRALKVRAQAGPWLDPFTKSQARAFEGPSNVLIKMLKFSGPSPKVKLGPTLGLGPSKKQGPQAGPKPGPITSTCHLKCITLSISSICLAER